MSRSSWQVEAAISSLACLLPGLRELDLTGITNMSYEPVRQQLMFENLASLPHLARLSLPSCRALEHVGALEGGRLEALSVDAGLCARDGTLSRHAASDGIARLRGLKHLEFRYCCFSPAPHGGRRPVAWSPLAAAGEDDWGSSEAAQGCVLRLLLNHLPPGPVTLLVVGVDGAEQQRQELRIDVAASGHHAQRIAVARRAGDGELLEAVPEDFADLAAALLDSRVLGPRLEQLELRARLVVGSTHAPMLCGAELAPLRALLQRCERLEVPELHCGSVDAAMEAVGLFGKPARLLLHGKPPGLLTLALASSALDEARQQGRSSAGAAAAASLLEEWSASGEQGSSPPALSAAALQLEMVQRWAASSPAPSAGARGGPRPPPLLLLLRGAVITALAQAPEALDAWMRWLVGRAKTTCAAESSPYTMVPARGYAGRGRRICDGPIASYQLLPVAGAVLVACGDAEGAADAVAAVAASAAGPQQAVPGCGGGAVEVLRLALAVADESRATWWRQGPARQTTLQALHEMLQAAWDGFQLQTSGRGAAAELKLLRLLLSAWLQLAVELPQEVLL